MAEQSTVNPAPNPLTSIFNPADWNLTSSVSSANLELNLRIIGQVIMVARTTIPSSNWLFCDGASYATGAYTELFSIIGYTYGGSGSNFNVPNFLSKTPVGADANSSISTTYGGTPVVSSGNRNQTSNQLAQHSHNISGGSFSYASSSNPNSSDRGNPSGTLSCVVNTGIGFSTSSINANNTGNTADFLPPFVVINYCIRAN